MTDKHRAWLLVIALAFMFAGVLQINSVNTALWNKITVLEQQLEQARSAGLPTSIDDLPDGSYVRADRENASRYVLLIDKYDKRVVCVRSPAWEIPNEFVWKDKSIKDITIFKRFSPEEPTSAIIRR